MEVTQQLQLMPQGATAAVLARIVVAEHAGHRQLKGGEQFGDTTFAVAEITHQEQGIRTDPIQHVVVAAVPLIVQIPGDGDVQLSQYQPLPRVGSSCMSRGIGWSSRRR